MAAASSGSHLSPLDSSFSAKRCQHPITTKGKGRGDCPQNSTWSRVTKRTLVVQQLLARLGGVLGVGALDDGVDGARLLAEAAVDALGHVNVVAGGAAGAVGALLGLDGDGLGGADLSLG